MVFLDGEGFMKRDGYWRSPVVLDNLIARRELPVMAAVFVDPGASIAKLKGKPVGSALIDIRVQQLLEERLRHISHRLSASPSLPCWNAAPAC